MTEKLLWAGFVAGLAYLAYRFIEKALWEDGPQQ